MTNNHVLYLTAVGLDYDDLGGPISGCWNQIYPSGAYRGPPESGAPKRAFWGPKRALLGAPGVP